MKSRAAAAFLAIALHLLVLWIALLTPRLVKGPPPPSGVGKGEEQVTRIRFFSERVHNQPERKPGDAEGAIHEEPCDGKFYVGIGIITGGSGLVSVVAPGGPADKAGIHMGDTLLNEAILGANRYPVGTPLVLLVSNPRGEQRSVALNVDRICSEA